MILKQAREVAKQFGATIEVNYNPHDHSREYCAHLEEGTVWTDTTALVIIERKYPTDKTEDILTELVERMNYGTQDEE